MIALELLRRAPQKEHMGSMRPPRIAIAGTGLWPGLLWEAEENA